MFPADGKTASILTAFFSLALCSCSVQSVYIRETFPLSVPPVVQDSIRHSLFLIGDAGEPSLYEKEKTFYHLKALASIAPAKTTIVFLGDNLYPRGLPLPDHPDRKEMERRIDEQINIGRESGAATIFIPGNHDWEYQGKNGLQTLRREEEYIASKNFPSVRLLPQEGSPGPAVVDIGEEIRVIAIDTQWWLHAFEKPLYKDDSSEEQTKLRFIDSLSWALRSAGNRKTVVIAHHPIRSHGEHGGFFDWKDHFFPLRGLSEWLWIPLPGIGSLYPLSRMWGVSDQDLSGRMNIEMRARLDSLLSLYGSVIYASGHEHTLQILQNNAHQYYLVSGNGIAKHTEALTTADDTILATRRKGFMRIDFLNNGTVRLGVIAVNDEGSVEIFSMMLL